MTDSYLIRAVQLDLGRQMETLEWIEEFIDFAAKFGYNALHLYLEGRIRTSSFPWRAPDRSYSAADMQRIVNYAATKGMDVQPNVNCFYHAEHFLDRPELRHLDELRGGIAGRFGAIGNCTFCPSLDETYAFLGGYLAEIAAIFPSEYFHVGCDEVWHVGYCSRCRERLASGESQGDLYAGHIIRLHEIVHVQLGKRMMMWDDMWEEYPEALDQIPADIIQCVWQYDDLTDQTRTHFGRRRRDHRLARFAERGTPTLICPATSNVRNTMSFTEYAKPFPVLGGLMTMWEQSQSFAYRDYLNIAFGGRRWADLKADDADLFTGVLRDLMGVSDEPTRQVLLSHLSHPLPGGAIEPEANLRGPVAPVEWQNLQDARLRRAVLAPQAERFSTGLAREVFEDILVALDSAELHGRVRLYGQEVYRHWTGVAPAAVDRLVQEGEGILTGIRALRERSRIQWTRIRPGLQHEGGREICAAWEEAVAGFVARVREDNDHRGLLCVRYALADQYGAQRVRWLVRYADGDGWEALATGTPKPSHMTAEMPLFRIDYPLPAGREPVRLRLETWGYGGIGVAHVEAVGGGRRQVPVAVADVTGKVSAAEALLRDDSYWCSLGEENTELAFIEPGLAEAQHSVEIALESRPLPWKR